MIPILSCYTAMQGISIFRALLQGYLLHYQLCIRPGSLNRIPASAVGKGGILVSVRWQVTLCDPYGMRVSSSGVTVWQSCLRIIHLLYFKGSAK